MNAKVFAIITVSVFTICLISNAYADSDSPIRFVPSKITPHMHHLTNNLNSTNPDTHTVTHHVHHETSTSNSTTNQISNSTTNQISNSTTNQISNSIRLTESALLTDTVSVKDIYALTNSTTDQITNSTTDQTTVSNDTTDSTNDNSTSSNETENTAPIPDPSWQFDPSSATVTNDNSNVQDSNDNSNMQNSNDNSLTLSGEDYLTQNVNSTRNLSNLTLSVWIKPDYSAGSPQFTVLSEANSFILAINNNIPPVKKASFSIFDGIKWNTVFSNSTIPEEEWTHLVAAFDGTSISIYINGTQESTLKLSGVTTIALNGTLTTKTTDNLSSDANIVIGAYLNTIRNTVNNKFSGNIENVTLYDSPLTPAQIAQLH